MPLFSSSKTGSLSTVEQQSKPVSHGLSRASLSSTSSLDSEFDAPPAYKEAVDSYTASSSASSNAFGAKSQLQIQAIGYDFNQALYGMKMENISVYRPNSGELEYVSLRLKRTSNSCALVRGSDTSLTPLISTVYRWGPGRAPRMRVFSPQTTTSVEDAINPDPVECKEVEIHSRSIISRTQKFDMSFGSFEWRFGTRAERREAYDAASLLILERTDAPSSAAGKKGKKGVRVAQLVRNDEFRTPGTNKCMGGNGGRLMMDLTMWQDNKQASVEDVEAFVVASCILMLKKEGDRFRDNQLSVVL